MFFIVVLILTTAAIAASAAFFSIYGLAQIFSGAFLAVVIMASALEAGKLMAASYVYRYWDKITFLMKTYLITSIMVLMLITSAGIFGFLSQAHIQSNFALDQINSQIVLLEQDTTRISQLKDERLERRNQIDADIANMPSTYVTGRQRLIEAYKVERTRIDDEVIAYDTQIAEIAAKVGELKMNELETKSHIGPILFIAEVLGKDVNTAIMWMIMLIMFAFDPLAVVLTIGVNIALRQRQLEKELQLEEPEPVINELSQLGNDPETENDYVSSKRLEELLAQLTKTADLTPEEIEKRNVVEEMLRKRQIKQRIRTNS